MPRPKDGRRAADGRSTRHPALDLSFAIARTRLLRCIRTRRGRLDGANPNSDTRRAYQSTARILAKITADGVFVEELEHNPAQYLPDGPVTGLSEQVVSINLRQPMTDIRAVLTQYPIKTRVSLTGPLIVARDIAHAKISERFDQTGVLPEYVKDHPIYYAGPAKTPAGYASGSFGPTTAGRMDSYVPMWQPHGASLVTLAKGNRSKQVTDSCKQHGGFYLGSVGGAAAVLAEDCIKKIEVLEFPELGMEAVWKIEVENFPAFILVDDKGNDFFAKWTM